VEFRCTLRWLYPEFAGYRRTTAPRRRSKVIDHRADNMPQRRFHFTRQSASSIA
jgi:hypothetical protein